MWKTLLILFVLSSHGLAQTSSDGSFSVRHLKKPNFSLNKEQMRDAETIYRNACAVVQRDFLSAAGELHLHFTVVIGADQNQVLSRRLTQDDEIWMKRWDPNVFAQGVVLLAVDQSLTPDVVKRLGKRAVRYSNATVDVSGFK
jgi:hypothetical protein